MTTIPTLDWPWLTQQQREDVATCILRDILPLYHSGTAAAAAVAAVAEYVKRGEKPA